MPSSDLVVRQWDIVIVPFPYADQLAEKRRPALVVSGHDFNKQTGLLWVAMITTSKTQWLGDIAIPDHSKCGLPVPSIIRTSKIATIEAGRVIRVAGSLSDQTINDVWQSITGHMSGLIVDGKQ